MQNTQQIIEWRNSSKSQVSELAGLFLQKLEAVVEETEMDRVKKEAAQLASSLPTDSHEAGTVLKANAAAIQALYSRCAEISENAAQTMTSVMNEALNGKHTIVIVDARSKNAPAIAWKNNVACFMVVNPSFLHTDGQNGYIAIGA